MRSAKKKSIARAASKPAKAKARVKASKIKQAGLKSRLLGHVSASGKRNQGRRNSDNR